MKYSYNFFNHRVLSAPESGFMPSGEEFISTGCDRTYGCVADTAEEALGLREAEWKEKIDKLIAWQKRAAEAATDPSKSELEREEAAKDAARLPGCIDAWSENLRALRAINELTNARN